MRKTKIICTIGPASNNEETFSKMCLAGLNVARINFSHGTYEEQHGKIEMIKRVREKLKLPIALLLDTKGPEYRIKSFKNGKIHLNDGDIFTFTTDEIMGDETRVSVNYKGLCNDLSIGDKVLVANGLLIFEVVEISGSNVICKTIAGGDMADKKSMSFPNKTMHQIYLSEQDKSDLLFGIEHGVNFVAASFVSCKQDVVDLRNFLDENGGERIEIIAKIENRSGVDNIEEICSVCSGIMVARGDLGVEVPFTELPAIQKRIINVCRLKGKRVITATEMLESMINNPRPTRAEISDVANAVYDGTSAVMLSGESAQGKYPVETVKTMADICEETEKHIHYNRRFHNTEFIIKNTNDAISHSAVGMAVDIDAKALAVASLSGTTVRMISRFRPPVNIVGLATNKDVWYRLSLSWGVIPVMIGEFSDVNKLTEECSKKASEMLKLTKGDRIVVTAGDTSKGAGATNLIKVVTVE